MKEQSNWEYWKEQWELSKDNDLEFLRDIYNFVMVLAFLFGLVACVKFMWYLV